MEETTDDLCQARLNSLAQEFTEALRSGRRPSVSEYIEKNADLADRIREVFSAILLLEGVREPASTLPSSELPAAPLVDPRPAAIGKYRLLGEIGRGGMGVVYQAEQMPLGRRVALKILSSNTGIDQRRIERFQREAHAAAALDHPHIVPIYEVGEERGIHFYAMKYVPGQGLDRVVLDLRRLLGKDSGGADRESAPPPIIGSSAWRLLSGSLDSRADSSRPPSLPEDKPGSLPGDSMALTQAHAEAYSWASYSRNVARLGLQAAEALSCAHAHGILHRDIKPSNLLLDETGKVWVADFGLVKFDGLEDLTRSGEVVGTLRYMAPERFRGHSLPESDVYGLGLTLYELLTLGTAFADSGRAPPEEEPLPLRQVDPRIPSELEAIVMKAIAKEPGRRHRTAKELALDLGRFLARKPMRPGLNALTRTAADTCRRHPGRAASLAALALLTILVGSWALFTGPVRLAELFAPPESYSLGDGAVNPMDLEVSDLDGDEAPDIVTANVYTKNLSLFRSNPGKGTFEHAGLLSVGEKPVLVIAVHLDEDRKMDLVVANRDSKDVVVLRNSGGANFDPPVSYSLGFVPCGLIPLDVDGDRDQDLVAAGQPSSFRILRNAGGKLEAEETVRAAGQPNHLAAGDVDRDGKVDLVSVDMTQSCVWVFDGAVGFRPREEAFPVGVQGSLWCLVQDLDGDTLPDLAVPGYFSNTLSVLRNIGRGRFAPPEIHPTGRGPFSVGAGDLDGDGRPELVVPCETDGVLALFQNRGKTFGPAENITVGGSADRVRIADLDGDRDLDLIATAGRMVVLWNRRGSRTHPGEKSR